MVVIIMAGVTPDQVLAELNRCRSNPAGYSAKVAKLLPHFHGLIYRQAGKIDLETNEGAAVVNECIAELKATHSLPLFQLSPGMSAAAQGHTDECGPVGHLGHDGVNGSTMDSRISDNGEWAGGIGENISYGCNTAEDVVVQLLVDDGVETRGHRRNILNPDFHVIGSGFGPHSEMEFMCCITFATMFTEKDGTSHGHAPANAPEAAEAPADDEPWPEGAVGLRTRTETQKKGKQTITKVIKEYTMEDGSVQTQETTHTE